MTMPSPSFTDTYPPEILEWSACMADPKHLTERQQMATDILAADDVMHAAAPVIATLLADADRWADEDRAGRLDGFWRFIEEAAALPDQQPPGAHLREEGEPAIFSTPAALRHDIAAAAHEALTLAERMGRIATTIQGEMPIEAARRAIETLDIIYTACTNTAHRYAPDKQSYGVPDFTMPGSTSGANAWGEWMLQRLDMLAALHLRGTYPELTHAVQRAIIEVTTERAAPAAYKIKGTRSFSATL